MSRVDAVQIHVCVPSLEEQDIVKAHEESRVGLTRPPAPIRDGRQSCCVLLSTEGQKQGAVRFCGSSKQTECDIPSLPGRGRGFVGSRGLSVETGACQQHQLPPANYESPVPFDLYGLLALISLWAPHKNLLLRQRENEHT